MANNLETITNEYIPRNNSEGLEGLTEFPAPTSPQLNEFICNIKDKKRRKEMEGEIHRLYSQYMETLKKYGAPGRAALLEQSYNLVPDEKDIEGKEAKEILEKRLYANPGRQYQYVNGIVGDKKKSKDIKGEIGRAAKYAIKEGWPVLGAGAAWWLTNRYYKQGFFKRMRKGFRKPIRYLVGESFRPIWGLIKTPAKYAIGAYAAYKVISYLIKRRKEKKLEHEEVERLENLRNEMLSQKQMFYTPKQQLAEVA